MLKMVDSNGQIALGTKYAGKYFEVNAQADGSVMLKPMLVIPEADAWIYTSEMQMQLAQADTWMQNNPPHETDLEVVLSKSKNDQ